MPRSRPPSKLGSVSTKSEARRRNWKDPEYRARHLAALAESRANPKSNMARSESVRRDWANPKQRARRLANMLRGMADTSPVQKSTIKPTIRDIAWAAGFLEGEGSFASRGGTVNAVQVNTEPLHRLQELFGGSIYFDDKRTQKNPNWQPVSAWSVSGARARGFAMTIYSLMSSRRQEQIKKMLKSGVKSGI